MVAGTTFNNAAERILIDGFKIAHKNLHAKELFRTILNNTLK